MRRSVITYDMIAVRAQPLIAVRDVRARLRDPDGYVVVIASPDGEAEGA